MLGDGVGGGKVHGDFPRPSSLLDPSRLYEGRDLPVTTDFRAVFSAVAGRQFAIDDPSKLFPGWAGEPLRLTRGA